MILQGKFKLKFLSAAGILIIGLIVCLVQEFQRPDSSVNQFGLAKMISVTDGDTVKVTFKATGEQHIIRLYGIDAPEKRQSFGRKSRDFLTELIGNDDLIVVPVNKDRYGRMVAVLYTTSNAHNSLNETLIRAGMAWLYPQYCKTAVCRSWLVSESKAERNRVGLWAEDHPVAPWVWRKR